MIVRVEEIIPREQFRQIYLRVLVLSLPCVCCSNGLESRSYFQLSNGILCTEHQYE